MLRRNRRATHAGFTLIELMITLAILAVLVAIALPSFASYLRRSARAEAQSFLQDAASRQQQYLVDRRAYAGSLSLLHTTPSADLANKFTFTVATTNGPPPTFTLTAQAIGNQTSDMCPTLTLDNAGNRSPASCW
jgi:type IV pilus assembly protein PilE